MKRLLLLLLAVLALAAAAGGGVALTASAKSRCLDEKGWQRLANRTHMAVYCPGVMPNPLDATIGGQWNSINSLGTDGSYLEGFAWAELGQGGEVHVNLRGYPHRTAIPKCTSVNTVAGVTHRTLIPCFASPAGTVHGPGAIDATMYTVNQDADQWHVAFVWRRYGSLYVLSQHVSPPLTYEKVVSLLKKQLNALVLVRPT